MLDDDGIDWNDVNTSDDCGGDAAPDTNVDDADIGEGGDGGGDRGTPELNVVAGGARERPELNVAGGEGGNV